MVSGLYEFKIERTLGETGLSGSTGRTSNLMEPFTVGPDVMDDKWNANGNLLFICGKSWLFNPVTRASSPPPFPPFSLVCTPLLPVLRPSPVSRTIPVIWSHGEGGRRFITADK